jgi:hypothetical protein
MLFPTSLVGSYPQPDWLIDRDRLRHRLPPRVRATELWRVDPAYLEQAQRDATLLAIRAQEEAGLDILTDGEMCRVSYSNRFATALDGVDLDHPGVLPGRSGSTNPVPRVTGPIRRRHPVEAADAAFLRASTRRTVKMTVPGPFTMAQQAQNDYYASPEDLAFGCASAVLAGRRPVHVDHDGAPVLGCAAGPGDRRLRGDVGTARGGDRHCDAGLVRVLRRRSRAASVAGGGLWRGVAGAGLGEIPGGRGGAGDQRDGRPVRHAPDPPQAAAPARVLGLHGCLLVSRDVDVCQRAGAPMR